MRTASALLLLLIAAVGGAETQILAITEPADVSDLVPLVEVRGTVADASGTLSWSIVGTDRGGEARIDARGSFAFVVPTDGLHLTQSLRIVARDSLGRSVERVLVLVDADPGPAVTLDAPTDGSSRGADLAISGSVADAAGGPIRDSLASLSWSLPPTGRGGKLEIDETGAFSTVVDCSGAGDTVLWLRAEDRFGHLTLRAVRLAAPPAPTLQASVDEPVAKTPPAETPVSAVESDLTTPAADATTRIEIISPKGVLWYRARVIVEGRLVDAGGVESLAWRVTGDRGPSGETLVDSDGTFRLELATSELSGERELEISADRAEAGPVRAVLAMRDGRLLPTVTIDEPAVGGSYGSLLVLAGTVADPYAGDADMGGYESLTWRIAPLDASSKSEGRSGEIAPDAAGSFSVSVATRGLDGAQMVSVVAVGRSGNTGRAAVRVSRGESDIPSFAAAAADGMVTLRWDSADEGYRYDVLYAVDAEIGDGSGARTLADVRSPLEVRGLANGSRYVFRLRARREGEPEGWSSDREALPLGRTTLQPTAVSEYGGVRLSWATVPGVPACEVLRSDRADGEYAVAAAGVTDSRWYDALAEAGLTWYYRVRPEIAGAAASEATAGAALEFAARALEPLAVLGLEGIRSIALAGTYAWVSCGPRGLRVVDLDDPAALTTVASVDLPDVRAAAVAGTTVCVADGERGIVVLDAAEPRQPRVVGIRYLGDPLAVALSSDVAYVACGTGGIRLVDVSDPRNPVRLDGIDSPDARALCLSAGRLFAADAVLGLRMFDLAAPKAPRLLAELAMPGARGVSVLGDRAIVAGSRGTTLVRIGATDLSVLSAAAKASTCAVLSDDGFAVIADAGGVWVLDATDLAGRPIDTLSANGLASLAVAGDLACLAERDTLRLLAVRARGRSSVVGEADVDGSTARIVLDAGRAFVAARSSGLLVFDVAERASRVAVRPSAVVAVRFAEDVAVAGALVLVADGAAGLRIVELTETADGGRSVRELSAFQPGGVAHGVAVSGSVACVAAGAAGVLVLDVSDPAVPRRIGAIASPDARDVAIEGTHLFVADAAVGLRLFDLAAAAAPVEVGPSLAPAARVSVAGGRALAVSGEGVAVVDWAGAGVPRLAGVYRTAWAEDACRDGDQALVAEGHRGLTVLDLADPSRPRVVSAQRELYAAAVSASDGVILVGGAGSVKAVKVLVPPWLAHAAR